MRHSGSFGSLLLRQISARGTRMLSGFPPSLSFRASPDPSPESLSADILRLSRIICSYGSRRPLAYMATVRNRSADRSYDGNPMPNGEIKVN